MNKTIKNNNLEDSTPDKLYSTNHRVAEMISCLTDQLMSVPEVADRFNTTRANVSLHAIKHLGKNYNQDLKRRRFEKKVFTGEYFEKFYKDIPGLNLYEFGKKIIKLGKNEGLELGFKIISGNRKRPALICHGKTILIKFCSHQRKFTLYPTYFYTFRIWKKDLAGTSFFLLGTSNDFYLVPKSVVAKKINSGNKADNTEREDLMFYIPDEKNRKDTWQWNPNTKLQRNWLKRKNTIDWELYHNNFNALRGD